MISHTIYILLEMDIYKPLFDDIHAWCDRYQCQYHVRVSAKQVVFYDIHIAFAHNLFIVTMNNSYCKISKYIFIILKYVLYFV